MFCHRVISMPLLLVTLHRALPIQGFSLASLIYRQWEMQVRFCLMYYKLLVMQCRVEHIGMHNLVLLRDKEALQFQQLLLRIC